MPYKKTCPPSVLDAWLEKKLPHSSTQAAASFSERLKQEQWKKLCETVLYAQKNSRFYAQRLSGFNLVSLQQELFHTLPFTTAQDLHAWESFICISLSHVERMVSLQTSGTTGPSKRIAFSQEDLDATEDFFAVGMSPLIHSGQRLLALWPGAHLPHGVSALLRKALSKNAIEVFDGHAAATEQSLSHELISHNPHTVVGAPCQIRILLDILENPSSNLQKHFPLALRSILTSGEGLSPELEQRMQALGLFSLDHYGITEAGYSVGVECMAQNGYHMRELDLFVEIIQPQDTAPMPNGQYGEVVITTLGRTAMPLIRYRTGDIAKILPAPCPCGSPLRRLSRLQGRMVTQGKTYSIEHCTKGYLHERPTQTTL